MIQKILHIHYLTVLLGLVFVLISVSSCKPSVPDKDVSYLSTLSGKVLSSCPNQPEELCIISLGKDQSVETLEDHFNNLASIAILPNTHIYAQAEIDRSNSTSTIHIKNSETNTEIRELIQEGFVADISWSANGNYFAFEVFHPDSKDNFCSRSLFVYFHTPANENAQEINIECIMDYAWAPLGNELVYSVRVEKEGKQSTGLYRWNVETGERTIILEPKDEIVHMSIQWSPDGQTLSFVEGLGPTESTGYLVLIDASSAKELYKVVPNDCSWLSLDRLCYAWSPDSTKIAFVKSTHNTRFSLEDLYFLNLVTGDIKQVTKTEQYALDDNFDILGINLSYPLWVSSSTITLFWTQNDQTYLVVTDLEGNKLSLITKYENIPQFYQSYSD